MDGYSDLPFRTLCRELGSAMSYTEFINAMDVLNGHPYLHEKLAFLSKEELETRVRERTLELEESREQLRALKDFHEQIVKNAPIGIMRTDKERRIIFANPKACCSTGDSEG
jgi:tRNA-dihydrouridine synthase